MSKSKHPAVNPDDNRDQSNRREWELSPDLKSFEAKLARLRPRDDRLNRERLAFLAGHSQHVSALDVDLIPLERVRKYIPLAQNIQVLDANQFSISQLPPRSFDLINALDVLEHVDDLPRTLSELLNLLQPGGRLVVSGPTENILYQIGRRLAGPEYSGEYHERGIAEIKRELKRLARVEGIATLYWPLPLFEVFVAHL